MSQRNRSIGDEGPGHGPRRPLIDFRVAADPPGAFDPKWAKAIPNGQGMKTLASHLEQQPWCCHINVSAPDAGKLDLDWQRIGPSAGYVLWGSVDGRVAASIFLGGNDADDSLAIETLERIGNPQISQPFIRRLRGLERPAVGLALGDASSSVRKPIVEMSLGIITNLCTQGGVKARKPALGAAMVRDFPPRFLHLLVVNGVVRQRLWPDARRLRQRADLQQAIVAFTERLEQSPDHFDEHMLLHLGSAPRHHRVEWQAHGPTAGVAGMTDDRQVRHMLLLLSGQDAAADDGVVRALEDALPYFVRGAFNKLLVEIRTGPRPTLVELVGEELANVDPTACGTTEALAAALFRKLGVF